MADLRYHVDGELVPAEAAAVSVRDRGFVYGDAVFETLRAYGGDVFRWDAHTDRLTASAEALSLDHGVSDAELKRRVDETLRANDLEDASVKLSVTRGVQSDTLTPDPEIDPTVVVQVTPRPRAASIRPPSGTSRRRSRRFGRVASPMSRSRRGRRRTTT